MDSTNWIGLGSDQFSIERQIPKNMSTKDLQLKHPSWSLCIFLYLITLAPVLAAAPLHLTLQPQVLNSHQLNNSFEQLYLTQSLTTDSHLMILNLSDHPMGTAVSQAATIKHTPNYSVSNFIDTFSHRPTFISVALVAVGRKAVYYMY